MFLLERKPGKKDGELMQIISSVVDMRVILREKRSAGQRVGLVPTMGSLHEGHLSLVRKAKKLSDFVIVSVFVNPIQFGPHEDLAAYPRDMARDAELCEEEGVDVVFSPSPEMMYNKSHSTYVEEVFLSKGLCSLSRPGHFRGVATIVAKLFNIIQPDIAVFGQKDAQQVRVIDRMIRDLNFPVKLIICPIVREKDGLAMSSRNAYLSSEERKRATCIYGALCHGQSLYDKGERDAQRLADEIRTLINKQNDASVSISIDYVEIIDYESLERVDKIEKAVLIAVAVRVGQTRLIDNIIIP